MANLSPTRKRVLMLIVLVGGGLLTERVLTLAGAEPEVDELPLRTRSARLDAAGPGAASGPAAGLRLDRLDARQRALEAEPQEKVKPVLFATVSWAPAPPPKPAPPIPPKPVAPPFPYSYMGGLLDDGMRTVFFNKGERVLPVKQGDTVDGAYRVDLLNDKQMQLTYLPLDQKLSVALGGGR